MSPLSAVIISGCRKAPAAATRAHRGRRSPALTHPRVDVGQRATAAFLHYSGRPTGRAAPSRGRASRPSHDAHMQLQLTPSSFVDADARDAGAAGCVGRCAARFQYLLAGGRRRRHLGARRHEQGKGRSSAASAISSAPRCVTQPGRASTSTTSSSRCSFSSPASRSCCRCRGWSSARAARRRTCASLRRALLLYGLGLIYYEGIKSSLGRHPLCRCAATHRDLLSVRLAHVPEHEPARHDRRLRRAARRLLGADDLRAGARDRRRLVWPRRQPRQLDRPALPAGPLVGQDARSGRLAARRCRRSAPVCSASSPACC